jgi:hypothetical protein
VFFHDFPTRSKESVTQRLTSADSVDLCFNAPGGSNLTAHINDIRIICKLAETFNKSPLISMPDAKRVIFGRAIFYAQGQETIRIDFCSLPLVLINRRSYVVSPDFTLLALSLTEEGYKHEQ